MTTTPSNDQLQAPTPGPEALARIREDQAARIELLQRKVESCHRGASIIAAALLEEAIARDWCSEYDQFVETVNARLPEGYPKLDPCERTWRVSFTVTCGTEMVSDLEAVIDRALPGGDSCSAYEYEVIS